MTGIIITKINIISLIDMVVFNQPTNICRVPTTLCKLLLGAEYDKLRGVDIISGLTELSSSYSIV